MNRRHALAGIAVRRMIRHCLDEPTLSGEAKATLTTFRFSRSARRELIETVADSVEEEPNVLTAFESAEWAEDNHQFLDWLLRNGGWQWIYEIARIVAVLFGWSLPPLPPIPPPPVFSEGGKDDV